MADEIDLELWLKLTGADKEVKIGDKPDLPLLKKLMKYELNSFWYQNLDLLTTRSEVDLKPTGLLNRTLVEGKRGMCFEGCELMASVLEKFNFDVHRVDTFVTVDGQGYQTGAIMTHYVIVVLLEGKKYLVDVIFGFNSIREPLEFSFEKTEERTVIPGVEQYRLEVHDDHCRLQMWLKDAWAPMYLMLLPIPKHSRDQLIDTYRRFLTTSQRILIRDAILKIGKLTEKGKIGFTCPFDSINLRGSGPYTRVTASNNERAISEKISFKEFHEGVKTNFGIILNENHFEP